MEKTKQELQETRWEEWAKLSFRHKLYLFSSIERQYGGIMRIDGQRESLEEMYQDAKYLYDLILRDYSEN